MQDMTTVEKAADSLMQTSSALISRNITVLGKRTSIRLEAQMWSALKEIADRERCSVHELCSLVATRRKPGLSLTASIRIFLMLYFKAASTEDGHSRAGHGGLDRMVGRLMPARRVADSGTGSNSNAENGVEAHSVGGTNREAANFAAA